MSRFLLALPVVAILAASAPARGAPCAGFTDVEDTSGFCTSVAWMKERAITLGCTSTLYCPADFVRRDQMAAFMYRLGFQNAFLNGGNAFGTAAVLGTKDDQPLDIRVNGGRVMRFQPASMSPNVVGGHPDNSIIGSSEGAAIAGGGFAGTTCYEPLTGTNTRSCANHAGQSAVVGGGYSNAASGTYSTVAGGGSNTASGTFSAVAGGHRNVASGDFSFAAGYASFADEEGCFLYTNWANGESGSCLGLSYVARFILNHGLSVDYYGRRMDGGGTRWVYIGDLFPTMTISTWTGAFLSDAGVWVNASSSQASKTGFEAVDPRAILDEVARMPITTWHYKEGEDGVRHIGPMAEDFYAAFQVGYGPHTIADLDARGVALAAIQGLNAKLEERESALRAEAQGKDAEIATLKREVADLRAANQKEIADLRLAVEVLMARTPPEKRSAQLR